jgi:UDP-N-acetyl-D-mannosaminuronate dehydrogenase
MGLYQSAWMLLDLACKPNVDDDLRIIDIRTYGPFQTARRGGGLLRSFCAGDSHDPRTSALGRDAVGKLGSQNIGSFDVVVIATNHQSVNYKELAGWADCIVDTRNQMAAVKIKPG